VLANINNPIGGRLGLLYNEYSITNSDSLMSSDWVGAFAADIAADRGYRMLKLTMNWRRLPIVRILFSGPENVRSTNTDECIMAQFRLDGENFGSAGERDQVHRFASAVASRLKQSGSGVYDGDEFGNGLCRLFFYEHDADRLFDDIYPLLSAWSKMKGGQITKRYGNKERSETINV